jgi:hypothetical protein
MHNSFSTIFKDCSNNSNLSEGVNHLYSRITECINEVLHNLRLHKVVIGEDQELLIALDASGREYNTLCPVLDSNASLPEYQTAFNSLLADCRTLNFSGHLNSLNEAILWREKNAQEMKSLLNDLELLENDSNLIENQNDLSPNICLALIAELAMSLIGIGSKFEELKASEYFCKIKPAVSVLHTFEFPINSDISDLYILLTVYIGSIKSIGIIILIFR